MKVSNTSVLIVFGCVVLCAGCQTTQRNADGVLVAYGNTTVEVDTSPTQAPVVVYREAESKDVVHVMAELTCQYPEGPTDLERQAYTSLLLEERGVDPDSFERVFVTTIANVKFTDNLETRMSQRCPAQLEAIFADIRPGS